MARYIDAELLEKDIRNYADKKCCNGETYLANGILKSLSILKEQPTINVKEMLRQNPLTCKGCENFSEDGFADICWGCRRNREIPDYYIKPEEIEKKRKELMEMKYFEIKQPYYALIKAEDKETAQSRYFYSLCDKVDCSQFGDTELQFCEIPRNRAIKKFISAGYPAQEIYNAKARVLLLDASTF